MFLLRFITIIPNTNSEDVDDVVNYLLSVSVMAGVNKHHFVKVKE